MLLAGGGPNSPDPRVLQAMALPVIGQFDPAFTHVMDDVAQLARDAFLTRNRACFALSAPRMAGLSAILNTLPDGTAVHMASASGDLRQLADAWHARGELLVVDATPVLGACELRVDDWNIDVCIAATDYALGGPPGLCLMTFSDRVADHMRARATPPRSNYLDLLQVQAYWSPERLNHHTAPTSLLYGAREALRVLVEEEGLEPCWARHQQVARALADGFDALDLSYRAEPPAFIVDVPQAAATRKVLREAFDIHVAQAGETALLIGLVGHTAQLAAAVRVLTALRCVLAKAS
jgi:aspartate aminotransferase-like enzyme